MASAHMERRGAAVLVGVAVVVPRFRGVGKIAVLRVMDAPFGGFEQRRV